MEDQDIDYKIRKENRQRKLEAEKKRILKDGIKDLANCSSLKRKSR